MIEIVSEIILHGVVEDIGQVGTPAGSGRRVATATTIGRVLVLA